MMALESCSACVSFQSGSLLQGPWQHQEQVCSVRGQLARGCACSLAAEPHRGAGPSRPTASLDKAPAARLSLFPGVYVTGSRTLLHFHLWGGCHWGVCHWQSYAFTFPPLWVLSTLSFPFVNDSHS